MANTHNRDFFGRNCQDDPVFSNSKTEIALPLSGERFETTFAGDAVFSQDVEDSKGRFPVDCPARSVRSAAIGAADSAAR